MKYGIIYKATSPSGKSYIGRSLSTTINQRKQLHIRQAIDFLSPVYNSAFSRAIRKYRDEITWTILYKNIPADELDDLEILLIKKYNSYHNGYNSTFGGRSNTGIKWSEKAKKRFSQKCTGRKMSKSARKKISSYQRGRKKSDLHKKKIAQSHLGKKVSEETKAKISLTMISNKSSNGENNGRAKLTWNDVNQIRSLYKNGNHTYSQLSNKYGVSKAMIARIITNRAWVKSQ